ncbi:glycoside hydrolase family 6 protein [Plantibacter sp. YIM 135249]|uniref:glycoside hydrolase family 6 protein n=1 Tax=Plantibacter sp. YIM 135249 TaxID=3423918 RepID=UPI003D34BA15
MPRTTRTKRRIRNSIVWGVVAVVLASAALVVAMVSRSASEDGSPFAGQQLYVDPGSSAAKAAAKETGAEKHAAKQLAAQPTAIWLLPERYPVSTVADTVASIVAQAETEGRMPVFVVYGVPQRDCGNQSAGGTASDEYQAWVGEIASSLKDHRSAVILEPDAVALAPDCGDRTERMTQLKQATKQLAKAGTDVYLDGGHSTWRPASEMAGLLKEAGIEDARGFATNVSNYNATDSELHYAAQLSELLGGKPFVIDTSRNGSGSNGEWCNPSGRTIGDEPLTVTASHLDANLWIKAPGESDGECGGGPQAGVWWPKRAIELAKGFSAW